MPQEAQNPLISVLMTCYKHEKFIGEALDGVLAQSYSPLDIVIIDDCSPDRTAAMIEARLAQHPDRSDIRFIRNEKNVGGWLAIEIALRATKGSFIVLSSGDDIMFPDMVAEMAKIWIERSVSLVTANALYIDENSKLLDRTYRDPDGRADDSFETLARDGANCCCFGAAMGLERAVYDTFGWPPDHLGTSDIMLPFYACLLKGACFISKPLLKYRVHSQNVSLSLLVEKSDAIGKLVVTDRIHCGHLAHALLMQDVLLRLSEQSPMQYSEVAQRLGPLVTIQIIERAKKLVRNGIELQRAGVTLGPTEPDPSGRATA